MAQNAEVICNPEIKTGLNTETYKVGIASAIIGMVAYIFLVVPILTLTIVGVMDLSDAYGIAVAIAFVITGLYVTEKFACRNI
jgi:hypothetical protein